jgi:hypothetical protein
MPLISKLTTTIVNLRFSHFTLFRDPYRRASQIAAFNYLTPNHDQTMRYSPNNLEYHHDDPLKELHEAHMNMKNNKNNKKQTERLHSIASETLKSRSRSNTPSEGNNQQVAQRRLIDLHEYYNVLNTNNKDNQKNNQNVKVPMLRKFGDTGELARLRNLKTANQLNGSHNVGYRSSKSASSICDLDGSRKISSLERHQQADPNGITNGKYSNFNLSKYLNIDLKAPNVRSRSSGSLSSSTNTQSSSGTSSFSSFDSIEQTIILQKGKCGESADPASYLGPFNFRQLLRPTQGPTESLRKRKGINPPSPPPLQRGKT